MKRVRTLIQFFLIQSVSFFILAYQTFTRGALPASCRQIPSCSNFALWAVKAFGLKEGLRLSFKRILTCHPF